MKILVFLFSFLLVASGLAFELSEDVYSSPIVKRLGIRKPPPHTLDVVSGQKHERDVAVFVNKQFRRHRHMVELLNNFFVSHPKTPLAHASQCVSSLNALIESKSWVKLAKSNRAILSASERKLLIERLGREVDFSESLVDRFTGAHDSSAQVSDPIAVPADPVTSNPYRRKKKNWSFLEHSVGEDIEADSLRRQEYERQLALRQEYARQRDEAQRQLQDAEQQRWYAEQQRLQAEQAARENRIHSFQGGLDSQAEISRQQEMWAEQRKRDAEMRAHQFP